MNNINSHYLIYCIKNFFVRFLKFFGFTFRLIVFENYSADRRRCDYRRFVFKKTVDVIRLFGVIFIFIMQNRRFKKRRFTV